MAGKIPAYALIADFKSYYAAKDGYIAGTSGGLWTQAKQNAATAPMTVKYGQQWVGHRVEDCSGAFVRAYKAHGFSIYHGSNRIAREYVVELLPIAQSEPGMAAFKARKPGEQLYDLPKEYQPGGKYHNGDLNDYYHIGLVDADPRYVLNAQGTATGFQRSKITDGWDYVARLKAVDYIEYGGNDEMGILYEAIVDSANDKPVNLRKQPSVNAARIAEVPDGTVVKVLNEVNGDWAEIDTGSKTGYMMRGYLVKTGDSPAGEDDAIALIRQIRDMADSFLKKL